MRKSEQSGFTGRVRATSAAIVLLTYSILVSCASSPTIATDVSYCCWSGADGIRTYRVEFEEMPEFLKPMLRDEVSVVLDMKGLEYTEEDDANATLNMAFINRTLETGEAAQDEAWETIAPGGGVRFIAEVRLEMTDAASGKTVWSGSMDRVHNVYEGSYMHDAPGRASMRDAFLALFADYPGWTDNKSQ